MDSKTKSVAKIVKQLKKWQTNNPAYYRVDFGQSFSEERRDFIVPHWA